MGEIINGQQKTEQPKPEQPDKQQTIKILFASIIIIFIFASFYYLNILLNQSSKQNNKPPTITPIPATKYSSNTFQYDSQKAETLLTQYMKDTIKPEFLPAKIEIKQGLSIDGRPEDVKYEFGSSFTINKDLFGTNFHYKESTNDPNDYEIFIQPGNIQEGALTPVIANSIASIYFNNPYSITSCSTKGTDSFCEAFKSESDGNKGYGLIFGNDRGKFTPIFFTCLIPKTSKEYATQKSCLSL